MAEFKKNTGQTTSEGCDETTAKKVITLQRAMTKKSYSFFEEKIGDTVSCRSGFNTNLSDATGQDQDLYEVPSWIIKTKTLIALRTKRLG